MRFPADRLRSFFSSISMYSHEHVVVVGLRRKTCNWDSISFLLRAAISGRPERVFRPPLAPQIGLYVLSVSRPPPPPRSGADGRNVRLRSSCSMACGLLSTIIRSGRRSASDRADEALRQRLRLCAHGAARLATGRARAVSRCAASLLVTRLAAGSTQSRQELSQFLN